VLVPTVVSLLLAATQATSSLSAPRTANEDRAVQYFHQAMKDYKEGRFREAIGGFLKADQLKPGADLMFNVAQSYEKLGDLANAIRYYRAYLARDPAATDRKAVEATIRNLEARQRSGAPAIGAPPAQVDRSAPPSPALQEAFVISLGIGGGLLALGLASGAVAAVNSGAVSGLSRPIPTSKAAGVSSQISAAHDFGLAANLFFIGASVALLTAGTLFLISHSSDEKPTEGSALRLVPTLAPGTAGLVAEGRF
jgi:tetratricopeptide (TPR) repeat protein